MKKKKTFLKVLNWLKDAGFKAFAILLIVAAGFYAIASITWPDNEPNPTTGVVGMFVDESTDAFGAGSARGYSEVNDLCATLAASPGSHVCTPTEMMNSLNHGNPSNAPVHTYLAGGGETMLWINNGPPGYTANSNDCLGWTAENQGTDPKNPSYGAVWNFQAQAGGLAPCKDITKPTTLKKFACCK